MTYPRKHDIRPLFGAILFVFASSGAIFGQDHRLGETPVWRDVEISQGWRLRQVPVCKLLDAGILREAEQTPYLDPGRASRRWLMTS